MKDFFQNVIVHAECHEIVESYNEFSRQIKLEPYLDVYIWYISKLNSVLGLVVQNQNFMYK